jgi:DnaA-homolog protein
MKQLVLDIGTELPVSLDGFVAGGNGELLARLRALAAPGRVESVYVWGAPGSGRSHLLRATQAAAQTSGRPTVFMQAPDVDDDLPLPAGGVLIVDDVERLSPAAQIALFRAFNASASAGLALLLAGGTPPLHLALREDLRTRIGSALIYEVRALSDEEKAETLLRQATRRGMRIEREVIDYLLRHGQRDLPSLTAALAAVDEASLEQKRPVTIPLVKEILKAGGAGGRG